MKRKFKVNGKIYTADISKDKEENYYFIECKELHSFTQGRTINLALVNIKEASELMLEVEHDQGSHHFRF